MTEQDFLEELQDILNTENDLAMNTELSTLDEWDSLSYVSFLAAMSEHVSHRIEPKAVRDAKTISDLYSLLQE